MSSNENQNYNLSFQHLKGGSFEGWTVNDLKGQINSLKILVAEMVLKYFVYGVYICVGKLAVLDKRNCDKNY